MIPVRRVRKPRGFDAKVKQPGDAWLKSNPAANRPKDLWSPYLERLAAGNENRCGYAAMLDPTGGTVDHYLSFKKRRDLSYEWSNYRFASQVMNATKQNADDSVLDPHEVRAGWFEILLPSLQMVATAAVPAALRKKAEYTLTRLKLRDGEKVVRWRSVWYEQYKKSGDLQMLEAFAPLVAEAVRRSMPTKPRAKAKVKATAPAKKARKP